MSMSIQLDQDFFNKVKEKKERKITFNASSRLSLALTVDSLNHSFLLSKLTFNLSKGHYYFIYEILKTKIEKLQMMGIEADPNEQGFQFLFLTFQYTIIIIINCDRAKVLK